MNNSSFLFDVLDLKHESPAVFAASSQTITSPPSASSPTLQNGAGSQSSAPKFPTADVQKMDLSDSSKSTDSSIAQKLPSSSNAKTNSDTGRMYVTDNMGKKYLCTPMVDDSGEEEDIRSPDQYAQQKSAQAGAVKVSKASSYVDRGDYEEGRLYLGNNIDREGDQNSMFDLNDDGMFDLNDEESIEVSLASLQEAIDNDNLTHWFDYYM